MRFQRKMLRQIEALGFRSCEPSTGSGVLRARAIGTTAAPQVGKKESARKTNAKIDIKREVIAVNKRSKHSANRRKRPGGRTRISLKVDSYRECRPRESSLWLHSPPARRERRRHTRICRKSTSGGLPTRA